MYVLEKLWRGDICPMERRIRPGSEYQQRLGQFRERMEDILNMLSPEVRARLESLIDLKSDISLMEYEDFFLYGFRLGAGTMLDIIGDYKGAFRES